MTQSSPTINDDDVTQATRSSTPPSPDTDSSLKINKKRERELSVEPNSSKNDGPSLSTEDSSKDPPAPAKKNRVEPLTQGDEEDLPQTPPEESTPPPLATSPRHESKVKHIQQRVEEMSWQDQADFRTMHDAQTEEGDVNIQEIDASHQTPPEEPDLENGGSSEDPAMAHDDPIDSAATLGEVRKLLGDHDSEQPLKRKLADRSTSYALTQSDARQDSSKRPRDDPDVDPNPREIKRVSPPPPPKGKEAVEAPTPPVSGFLAFASSSSPFSTAGKSVVSPPIPSSKQLSESRQNNEDKAPEEDATPSVAKPKPVFGVTTAPGVGFTGFASLGSPFTNQPRPASPFNTASLASVRPNRSKSPTRHGVAFTPYNSAIRGFATPKSPRRKRSASPNGSVQSVERGHSEEGPSNIDSDNEDDKPTSFSERLRKEHGSDHGEDSGARLELEEKEVITGEEDERTVYSVRAKLYMLNDQRTWTEKGIGPLKLNVRKTDGGGARLVMRKEGVHSLVLNTLLFSGMKFEVAQDPRYVRFATPNENKTFTQVNVRLSSAKAVEEFVETVEAHVPSS